MLPMDKLEALAHRVDELDRLLCEPGVASDNARYRKLTRERAQLDSLTTSFERYKRVVKELAEDRAALNDPELRELVAEEIPRLEREETELERSLTLMLLPPDPNDGRNVILEIRAAEGGDEATIFAADLFRMYSRYAEKRRWKVEIESVTHTDVGGYREVIANVSGDGVYSALRFEGGVHRVQRVPATEAQGRVHTSTASVAVLPEADEVEVHIDEADLQITKAASGGKGGQGVNTTNSAVQIVHKPTGMIVKCQDERSQIHNLARARKVLAARLLDIERRKQEAAITSDRRAMVGTGERAEKVRTYNYPQNRITEHRLQLTLYKLDRFIHGDLDEVLVPLRTHHQAERLHRELGIETSVATAATSGGVDD
jgi:peptide chain release factor 1